MSTSTVSLHSRLPIDQCRERLTSAVDVEKWAFTMSGYAGAKPILGRIRGDTFRLQKRRTHRNSFAPLFYGQLVSSGNGTLIEGAFRMHPAARAFMVVWLVIVIGILATMVVLIAGGQIVDKGSRLILIVVPVNLVIFGVALVVFGQWLSRKEKKTILEFLTTTFEASDPG